MVNYVVVLFMYRTTMIYAVYEFVSIRALQNSAFVTRHKHDYIYTVLGLIICSNVLANVYEFVALFNHFEFFILFSLIFHDESS